MQPSKSYATIAWLLFLVSTATSRAADVLSNVPGDAHGFIVARNLAAVDRKVQQLILNLRVEAVGPLIFLQGAMGIRDGLDTSGDLLLVVLPPQAGGDRPQFCVWLPIGNYDRLVAALGGSSAQEITAVTIAGEDLLIARQSRWALIMDPDQRERMQQTLAATNTPPEPVSEWMSWIDTHDVTVVALSGGVRDVLDWATADVLPEAADQGPAEAEDDDIFGPAEIDDTVRNRPSRDESQGTILSKFHSSLRQLLSRSPKTLEWAHGTQAIGFGLRLDDGGNVHASIRAAIGNNADLIQSTNRNARQTETLPALHQGGELIVSAAGQLPPPLTAAAASAYVRTLVDEMKSQEQLSVDETTLARFQQAVEQAAATVESIAVLSVPGGPPDGVYTNNFLAVRVASAQSFVDQAGEVMRLWNQMNRDAERGTQLIFDVDTLSIGNRAAKQYSLDLAAADGAPALPEIRQAMEKLFGPGGKLRLFIVPVDEQTALLATATPEQVATMLETLDLKQPNDWNREPLGVANGMLPLQADWRLFFSPHGYTKWLARQMEAITGPVFGGPLVKEFPVSPPIGAAGGAKDRELWANIVVPADTIRAMGTYRQRKGVQLQQ